MDEYEASPECQALISAAAPMSIDDVEAALAADGRVGDARMVAAYLILMGGSGE